MEADDLYAQSLEEFENPTVEDTDDAERIDVAKAMLEMATNSHRDRIYFSNGSVWSVYHPIPPEVWIDVEIPPRKMDLAYLFAYISKHVPNQPRDVLTSRQLHYLPEGLAIENGVLTTNHT